MVKKSVVKQLIVKLIGVSLFLIGTQIVAQLFVLLLGWSEFCNKMFLNSVTITPTSDRYKMWKEPLYSYHFDFYFFNITNSGALEDAKGSDKVKPQYEQLGPYVFMKRVTKENITFNDNDTISYNPTIKYDFNERMSRGSLDDLVRNYDAVLACAGGQVSEAVRADKRPSYMKNPFVAKELAKKKVTTFTSNKVIDLLFDGAPNGLLDYINENSEKKVMKKFAWFSKYNTSDTVNLECGNIDIKKLGNVAFINYNSTNKGYTFECSSIEGSVGEVIPSLVGLDSFKLSLAQFCTHLTVVKTDPIEKNGLVLYHYIVEETTFDNSSKDPTKKCYLLNKNIPSGVRDVSTCFDTHEVFLSFPHYYLGDSVLVDRLEGLHPTKKDHEMFFNIEPNTGFPLQLRVNLQISVRLQPYDNIPPTKIFPNNLYVPMFWFQQRVVLENNKYHKIRMLLNVYRIGLIMIVVGLYLGLILTVVGVYYSFCY